MIQIVVKFSNFLADSVVDLNVGPSFNLLPRFDDTFNYPKNIVKEKIETFFVLFKLIEDVFFEFRLFKLLDSYFMVIFEV